MFDWKAAAERATAADELLILIGCSTVTDPKAHARVLRGDQVPEDQLALRRLEAGERVKTKDLPGFAVASIVANRCAAALADAPAAHAALVAEYGEWREVLMPGGARAFAGIKQLPDLRAAPTKEKTSDGE